MVAYLISYQIMKDPQLAPDMHTYEKDYIEQQLSENNISPFTRKLMQNDTLLEDFTMKQLFNDAKEHNISQDIFKYTVETKENQ